MELLSNSWYKQVSSVTGDSYGKKSITKVGKTNYNYLAQKRFFLIQEKWELNVNISGHDRCHRFHTKHAESWSVLSACHGTRRWCVCVCLCPDSLSDQKRQFLARQQEKFPSPACPPFLSSNEIWYSQRVSLSLPHITRCRDVSLAGASEERDSQTCSLSFFSSSLPSPAFSCPSTLNPTATAIKT